MARRLWFLAALCLALLPLAAAQAAPDRHAFGFTLQTGPHADSGWIGARTLPGKIVYRVDPGARNVRPGGFGQTAWVTRLHGRGSKVVSTRATSRAAWIVAKFGSYHNAGQAAAVEVALDHLLYGGRWALNGSRTTWRLDQTGAAAAIRELASTMLDESARYAGPYVLKVTGTHPTVGSRFEVTGQMLTRRTRLGVPSLPVTISYPGQPDASATTDDQGRITVSFPAGAAGPKQVVVTVHQVPENHLGVLRPRHARASRVVMAHRKFDQPAALLGAVQAIPGLAVSTIWPVVGVGQRLGSAATLSAGYPSGRRATVVVHLPSTTPCGGRSLHAATVPVAADGRYRLPDVVPSIQGWYDVSVSVPGDAYNLPVQACGARTKVIRRPALALSVPQSSIRVGRVARATVRGSDYAPSWSTTATVKLWGPFPSSNAAACGDPAKRVYSVSAPIGAGAPSVTVPGKALTARGWYVWLASTPADGWDQAAATTCRAAGSLVRVVR